MATDNFILRYTERLFAALEEGTRDLPGVTRASYGAGEQWAHDMVRREAEAIGATTRVDAAGNLYMTRPGTDPALPAIVMGSHLDSVPHGGNYDGATGVIGGLAVLAELDRSGVQLQRDLTVTAIRAEEAVWFPLSYPGSEAAFGRLPPSALDARRADTGRTLASHMDDLGFDAEAMRRGEAQILPENIAAFLEFHIEQGPRLIARKLPFAMVTAINGGFRYPEAVCLGTYAHSGAEPRFSRMDAVLGFSDLVQHLETLWDRLESEGYELTITFGRVESDAAHHGGSRVLGKIGFSLDVRCEHDHVLERVDRELAGFCQDIAERRSVRFDLGSRFAWASARMDKDLIDGLKVAAWRLDLPAETISSGAGHDSAVFADVGIPTAMIFIRNANGSHNPYESMDVADLAAGVAVVVDFVLTCDQADGTLQA